MNQYHWKHGDDYITINYGSAKHSSISHRIKGITGWHEFNFDLLAFLVKKLYT